MSAHRNPESSAATATVLFYISGHGFGHASRQVEIMNALAGVQPGVDILLRTSVDPGLLARTVRVPYRLLAGACDPGIIQRDSVTHDDEASVAAVRAFYGAFEAHVRTELTQLAGEPVAAVVGDIPPLAFAVAARLGVPSIAIANFTWDWIYEVMPGFDGDRTGLLGCIRTAYRQATRALALPFTGGFGVFPHVESLPLVARHATRAPDETRARLESLGVDRARPLVLLSFGGYGLPAMTAADFGDLGDWAVVTTDRTSASLAGSGRVTTLPEALFRSGGLRYEDLVAAADVVISKPGYGIIAECAANDTALVYTSRGAFREYDVLVAEMPRFVRCAFLSQADLRAGRWKGALEQALAAPRPPRPRTDGAQLAARAIGELLVAPT